MKIAPHYTHRTRELICWDEDNSVDVGYDVHDGTVTIRAIICHYGSLDIWHGEGDVIRSPQAWRAESPRGWSHLVRRITPQTLGVDFHSLVVGE